MATEIPEWVQQLGFLGTVIGAITGGIAVGWKKGKPADHGDERKGEGVVVAGSFMERQAMLDLATSVRNLDGTAREILEVMREAQTEHRIEEKAERAIRKLIDQHRGDL